MYRKCVTEVSARHQKQVEQALLELMLKMSYEDITVTQLCQTAGISRRVFYHLFTGKTDAAAFFTEMSNGQIGPDMPMWGMLQNFDVEMLLGMRGTPEATLKVINKKLNAFDLME